ncbi:phage tail protein [Pectobacterium aroidearum]|uniref:phage tail-collar fiber domain-containing protein n=1 Tax=Pectobacterium aroidearum TaxID=1201031 RepID=UPI003018436C
MQSAVTRAFEVWNVNKVVDGLPAVPDSVVFALIPDQDENAPVNRDEGMPAAEHIRHRAAITQAGILNANAVVYSVVLDTTIGDWDYNWIGLVDSKTNTVLMIVHVRTQQKLKTRNGQQGNSLTRNLSMQFDGAAEATQINVSAETWQIDFSARLFGMDEAHRLAMRDYYGNAAFLNDGFRVSLANGVATVAAGVGYVGGLRARLDAAATLNVSGNTSVWLDVSRQGTVTGAWENRITLTAARALADYIDQAGYVHYVVKLSEIVNGQLTDNRPRSPVAELDDRFIQKSQNGADIPDRELFNKNIGSARAYSAAIDIGGVEGEWATADFIGWLRERGAFSHPYWVCRGTWTYARNRSITDTECGHINLTGAVVEVFGHDGETTIRVTTPSAAPLPSHHTNAQFTYVFNGADYFPGWRRDYNTRNKPTAADVGALPITGGALEGGIRIGAGNIDLPATRAVVGVMHDGSYRQMLSLSPDNTVVIGSQNSSAVIHTTDRAYIAAAGGAWHSIYHDGNLTTSTIGALPTSELAGIPLPFPGAVAPAGWLKCNGQQFDTAQFPVLASRYPSGFLPDLRGEFVRGWDDGRGADAGRALLSAQGDAIRNITGSMFYGYDADVRAATSYDSGALYYDTSSKIQDNVNSLSWNESTANLWYPAKLDASRIVPTASENRPRNIAFNYIVRAA